MALLDVKEYYLKLIKIYNESVVDLADFEKELKDKNITDDRLEWLQQDLNKQKENVNRVGYILYLFNLPKRKKKKIIYKKKHESDLDYFNRVNASDNSVIDECIYIKGKINDEIKESENE
jgi:hypothetical protein